MVKQTGIRSTGSTINVAANKQKRCQINTRCVFAYGGAKLGEGIKIASKMFSLKKNKKQNTHGTA